ncbi:hypothetical protein SAMN05421759_1105 [Roseivivax lentus]|uniref:Uncharacterized protein n=1 Tax=Roseivivax lentus TaxID=633194 RepID=A0A1N7NRT3_9RHOB|nr:hypothetical protein [Roseivivax lentus]SIT01085.1 hypothetical protein SAMN05421759_1105 [Roseivivax lentus]
MSIRHLPQEYIDQMVRFPHRFLFGGFSKVQRLSLGVLDDLDDWRPEAFREFLGQVGPHFPSFVKIPFTHIGEPAVWKDTSDVLKLADEQALLAYLPASEGFTSEHAAKVMQLLREQAPDGNVGNLGPDDMRALYGRARRIGDPTGDAPWISVMDVVRGLARAADLFEQEAIDIAGDAAEAALLKADVMQIDGIQTAAGALMTRSGRGWGTRFEVQAAAIFRHIGHEIANIRISFPMKDELLGPDLGIYRGLDDLGRWVFSVIECKAIQDFNALVSAVPSSESLRKIGSTVRRFGAQDWMGAAPGRGFDDLSAIFDGGYSFAFNFDHFMRNGAAPITTIANQAARYGVPFDATKTGVALIDECKRAMRDIMDLRGLFLGDCVNILRTAATDPVQYTDEIGEALAAMISNQVRRTFKNAKPPHLSAAEITPEYLLENNFIGPSELDAFRALAAGPDRGAFMIAATRAALGLTEAQLQAMPPFHVTMVLVEEGGGWIKTATGTVSAKLAAWWIETVE